MLQEFTDEDGVGRIVWSVQPDRAGARARFVTPDLSNGCLCFQSIRGETLRLTPTPPDWAGWSETDLRRALKRAELTVAPPRDHHSPDEGA